MKSNPTTKRSMARVPASCPQCGSHEVSWSPLRVWCVMCSFQTATRDYECSKHTIKRWNRAVRDGIGYVELLAENRMREAKKREKQFLQF